MSQQSEITQEKILNILMKDQDILGEFLKHKNAVDLFDNSYRMLFDAMVHSHSLSVLLTKDSYKEFVKKQTQNNKLKTISEEQIFVKIHSLTIADKNDYPVLLDALLEQHSKNKIRDFFDKFQKEKDKNYKNAIRNLHINLDNLISEPSSGKYQILDLSSYFDDWYKGLVEKRENPQKRLLTGIKEIDESMQTGLTNGQLTLFVAEPGGMKCVPDFAIVNCEDGIQRTVRDLISLSEDGKVLPKIQSLRENNKLYYQNISAIGYNGSKKCFKVQTSRGFSLIATGNHPILTPNGYVPIDDLFVGKKIGISRWSCFGNIKIDISNAVFLAGMIADGGTTGHGYRFTNFDEKIANHMQAAVEKLGGRFTQVINNKKIEKGQYHVSGCKSIGVKYDINNVKSIHKKIPTDVFGWCKDSVSEFLKMLFSCDGSFVVQNKNKKNNSYLIKYYTSSLLLAEGVRDLLLKFSINSIVKKVNRTYKNLPYTCYTVSIRDGRSIALYMQNIGFVGYKQEILNKHKINILNIKCNPNHDTIPVEFWNKAKKIAEEKNIKFPRRETLGIGSGPISSHGGIVSRDLFNIVAKHIDNDELISISESDIFWDTIESITDVGFFDTYDISMPHDHNFVCNNIITHNSMMMMNIALNIFMNSGESVVFISLEMTKDKVMNRIISRETNIDLKKISQPDLLSSEELESVKNAHKKWSEKMNRFILIDNEERMTVSDIRRIVEKYHSTFKFKVLFIDYMAILQPDEKYLKQNEYAWPGEMCKDLRQMGRKFEFSIISAVQLGKEALKRLKQQKQANKTAGVEDMKGSHDYSADADNIYIQWPHPQEPVQKLCVVCAKARDGKKTFIGDAMMAVLEIKPHMQKIGSDNLWKIGSADEVNDVMHKKYGGDIPDLDNLDKDISEKPLNAKKIISTKASKVSDISFLDD